MTLHTLLDDEQKAFEKQFQGLPPQWCPNCHTLGCGYGAEDTRCGNCGENNVAHFQSSRALHDQKIITAVIGMCKERKKSMTYESFDEDGVKSIYHRIKREVESYNQALSDLQQALKKVMV